MRVAQQIWSYIASREPSRVTFALRAVIYAALGFGYLGWSDQQVSSLLFAVDAILTTFVRSQVTTRATLEQAGTSKAEIVAMAAANEPPKP